MLLKLTTDRMLAHIDDGIGWMTFNQPEKHNALSLEMSNAIADILETFEHDDNVRVVVMEGAGGKAFVSGADISEFDEHRASARQDSSYVEASQRGKEALRTFPKPLIAMICGYCIGGGLAIALHADVRFATPDSTFGIPAVRLGLGYDYDDVCKLAWAVGPARARDILISARFLNASEALATGLIQFICGLEEIEMEVLKHAKTIAANAPLTIRAVKASISAVERFGEPSLVTQSEELTKACFDSSDYDEGRKAFSEKRDPVFLGR